jgi:uncharacterized RDD family membrane protein YckC
MKMKCKRCQAQVPDDANVCPQCGQDLASLRQLLQISYEEEMAYLADQGLQPPKVDSVPVLDRKDEPAVPNGPRIILDPPGVGYGSDSGPGFSPADPLSAEEDFEKEENLSGWEHALRGGFGLRFMAFAIDHCIVFLLFSIFVVCGLIAVGLAPGRGLEVSYGNFFKLVLPALVPLGLMLGLTYFSFFHGAWGQTIGKMIFGLRVVRLDGQPLTFLRALVRTLSYAPSAVPFFLGFFWVGLTSAKRSWHDRISGTMVTREQ